MHRDQYKQLVETLINKKVELQRSVAALETGKPAKPLASDAPFSHDEELLNALSREVIRELGSLNMALARAKSGQLGVCSICKQRIAIDTLRATPCIETCTHCADDV